uniref:DNA polymerase ligase N-terminal domain-containing protein n=1 Tax=Nitrosomonas supralitoralis TaxID=2116706 RepID=UPI001F5B60DD|nr:DNA polymerase ligase N-terminal domain-containing protein [Nitrosomonas supralitoralis]
MRARRYCFGGRSLGIDRQVGHQVQQQSDITVTGILRSFFLVISKQNLHGRFFQNAELLIRPEAAGLSSAPINPIKQDWKQAGTKGPNYNPADKWLAVRTEDHQMDYNDFEGVIPKKTVRCWSCHDLRIDHKQFEYGSKASIASTAKGNLIVEVVSQEQNLQIATHYTRF